jgi:hypothetical protein
MNNVRVTIPKSRARQFEDLLMDYQRTHNRGQFGVSLILGGISEDLSGNLTYPPLPDQIVLPLLKNSKIPYSVN